MRNPRNNADEGRWGAGGEEIPNFQPPDSHSRFPSNRNPAPEHRLCRMPDASASAEPPVLFLLLSWGSVPLVPNGDLGEGGAGIWGPTAWSAQREVRAAPALVPDLCLSDQGGAFAAVVRRGLTAGCVMPKIHHVCWRT